MKQETKIAILGGGGRTGKYIVSQLLNQGYSLTLLLRKPEDFQLINSRLSVIKGDAINKEDIHSLLKGCHVIISTIGQRPGEPLVASCATANILEAMAQYGISRYILVAGLNIDTPFDRKGSETIAATEWMKTKFPEVQEDRQKTYTYLLHSDTQWTLVRVPLIEFTEAKRNVAVDLEDCPGTRISAGNIANFIIEQLDKDTYVRKSPFIADI